MLVRHNEKMCSTMINQPVHLYATGLFFIVQSPSFLNDCFRVGEKREGGEGESGRAWCARASLLDDVIVNISE